MGLFGPSKRERFVQRDAAGLGEYLKNNSVKFGGEAYARCLTLGVFPKEIDKDLLWYFWSTVYGYRAAEDTVALRGLLDKETLEALFKELIHACNKHLQPLRPAAYPETFSLASTAFELIDACEGKPKHEPASLAMLHAVRAMPGLDVEEKRFMVVKELITAITSFPTLRAVIDKCA